MGPGIAPASPSILVMFSTAGPQWKLPNPLLIKLCQLFFFRAGSLSRSSEQLLGHKEGPRDSVTLLDAKELLKFFTSDGLPIGDLQPLQIQKG